MCNYYNENVIIIYYLSFLNSAFLFRKLETNTCNSSAWCSYICPSCCVKSDTVTKENILFETISLKVLYFTCDQTLNANEYKT